jgi:glutathionyl-hydroquinone reductase
LKSLEDIIKVIVVHPNFPENNCNFDEQFEDESKLTKNISYKNGHGFKTLKELYLKNDSSFNGKHTVPVLWDSKSETIVNNESSQILRILNESFNEFTESTLNFYPNELKSKIDEVNQWIFSTINTGVSKCGFAQKQEDCKNCF